MNHVTLVTGASRGIGAATALRLGAAGHAVAVNYARDAAAADSVVEAIGRAGGEALAVQADVSSEADVLRMFEAVDRRWGRLTGLVNNAGVVDAATRVEAVTLARLERIFAVNVFGSFLCAREAVKRMQAAGGGAIVNVSSVAARLGSPNEYVDYASAKAAIDTFTRGLALEVVARGIRVNAVRPGIVATEIHASGGQPDRVARLGPLVPMQRAGTADEVAAAIAWLLSDEASYCTGAIIDVSGGR
ncbi:MAG TPA: SDR family oxidoreductase [Ideonella sp.]|nr:SDR family oxidoreductase [Ideonella sp.]